ncbi:hypothetical protein [Rhodococcus sp. NPDC047139]
MTGHHCGRRVEPLDDDGDVAGEVVRVQAGQSPPATVVLTMRVLLT